MTSFTTWMLIVAALVAPEGSFIHNPEWIAKNSSQEYFLTNFFSSKNELSQFSENEMNMWASQDHEELNTIAHENAIPITFDPFPENGFGTLAVMDVNLTWKHKPTRTTGDFFNDYLQYYKVKTLSFAKDFDVFFSSGRHPYPIIKIATQSGDHICVTIADPDEEPNSFSVAKDIKNIRQSMVQRSEPDYPTVILPQFTYNGFIDISWILGMSENKYEITQAAQYLKLTLDDTGCKVKSGVGLGFMCISCAPASYVFNKPFYFWIERSGMQTTLVEGYVDGDALIKA